MNSNKKKIYFLVVIAVLLISIVGAISYGFFNADLENKVVGNYVVEVGEDYTFSVSGNPTTDVALSSLEMFGSSYDTVVFENDSSLTIELKNDNATNKVSCTFDYLWRWDLTYDSYVASDASVPEYVVSGPFAETQVPNYNVNKVLGSSSITAEPNTTKTEEIAINAKFYNLKDVDQNIHANKTYKGGVIIDNVNCQKNI